MHEIHGCILPEPFFYGLYSSFNWCFVFFLKEDNTPTFVAICSSFFAPNNIAVLLQRMLFGSNDEV